jgi:hypothetical protein
MQPSTVALVGAGVAVVGTLGGVVIGQSMTSNAQQKQWRRDNVRQECRELLGQFSVSVFALVAWLRYLNPSYKNSTHDGDGEAIRRQYSASVLDLHRNLGSRVLIAIQIKEAQIGARWKTAVEAFQSDDDEVALEAAYQGLVDDIVQIGLKE